MGIVREKDLAALQLHELEAQVSQTSLTWVRLSYVTLCQGGHLGYHIRLLLAIQSLMLFEEFQNCHHGRNLGYWNAPCLSSIRLRLPFCSRCELKLFKMDVIVAILDIRMEPF